MFRQVCVFTALTVSEECLIRQSSLYREGGLMLFLIDYENVGNAGMKGCGYLDAQDHIIVFYSDARKNMEQRFLNNIAASGCAFEVCKLCQTGKNALDFYIISRLGEIIGSGYNGIAVIVSKDGGFRAVQDYWEKRARHRSRVLLSGCVEDGIVSGNENNERTRELKKQRESLSIGGFYAVYTEKMRTRMALQALFAGTEYAGMTGEIQDLIEEKEKVPRAVYLNSLRLFGRKDGLEIYNKIKTCDKLYEKICGSAGK